MLSEFDGVIDDLLSDTGQISRQDAVDLHEIVHAVRKSRIRRYGKDDPRTVFALPLAVEKLILACAKDGLHTGQGKGRPRSSAVHDFKMRAIVTWAQDRRDELHANGMKKTGHNSAEDQAADEARVLAKDVGVIVAASTIKREMQSR